MPGCELCAADATFLENDFVLTTDPDGQRWATRGDIRHKIRPACSEHLQPKRQEPQHDQPCIH